MIRIPLKGLIFMERKKKGGKGGKILYYSLLGIFSAVFIFSAAYLIKYWVDSRQASSDYDDLASRLESLRATMPTQTEPTDPPPPATDPSTGETVVTEPKPTEPKPAEPQPQPTDPPVEDTEGGAFGDYETELDP